MCHGRNNEVFWLEWPGFQSASKLLGTLIALRCAGIDKNSLIDMNDSGMSFDEIADYLETV